MSPVVESPRVQALRRYCAPDAPAEPELAAVLRLASVVADVPTATVNLLDDEVQQNYCTLGFEGTTLPRDESMCHVTVVEGRAQHVPDATRDPRFAANPWVDGRKAQVRFYASSPLVTDDGHVIGTLCVFGDEAKELTSSQQRALDDLAGQVMALLERRRLAREAEAATEAKSRFLAAVSHEIRTPLNGVLGMLDLLLATPLDEGQERHAHLAKRSGETLMALLDGVLDLSKGEAGQVVLRSVPFDPVALVTDVVDVLSALTTRHGTTLSARVEGAPAARLLGDPDRLRQVVVNLTGNALKFTTEGSVEVVVSGADGHLVVEVRDTGEGIAPEELETLFRPFAQGASGARHGGTGLGLSICAELVGLMGGALTCDSELGVGTTMRVELDLPVAVDEEGLAGAGLRVLVVDDDLVNQLVAVGLLEAAGAEAVAVGDGEVAVEALRAERFDVALVDYELPGMDGAAVARAVVGAGGASAGVVLLALTGHTGGEQVQACLDAGMAGALGKPLRPADLDAALRAVPRR